jgi:HlyD family secretion protein
MLNPSILSSARLFGLSVLVLGCTPTEQPPVALGTLEWDRVELVAEAFERIVAIDVVDGQQVRAGDPVLSLDGSLLEARLAQLDAALEVSRARLDEVLRGPREEAVAEARAAVAGAGSRLHEAELEVKRQQQLVDRGLGSQATLDRAVAIKESAQADRDQAQESLNAAVEGSTDEVIRQARSALAQSQAAVDEQRLRLSRMQLTSPVSGRIDDLPLEVGDRPRLGETVAVLLVGDGPYALSWLPEPMKARVKVNDQLQVRIDGRSEPMPGRVRHISREAAFTPYFSLSERDRSRLVYRMEVDLPNAGELGAGTPVQVVLPSS